MINYILFMISFFQVSSGTQVYQLSQITIKIKGKGIQTIFRNVGCKFPDEIIDIKHNKSLSKEYCKSNELCNISASEEESLIRIFWNIKPSINCREMFFGLTNIIEVDLSKFDVSITSMGNLFKNCISLEYVNLTNVNTTQTYNMGNMFTNCSLLTSVDLSSFDTSKVSYLDNMFYNCSSLTSLNLSHFNTSLVINIELMFYNCYNLTSLNLSNFDFSKISRYKDKQVSSMFYNCSKLNYLNIEKYIPNSRSNHLIIEQIIFNTTKNLAICINNINTISQENINKTLCPLFDCSDKFYEKQKKIIKDNNTCVEECNMIGNYYYEFENKCYNNCPQGTYLYKNNKCVLELTTTDIINELAQKNTKIILTTNKLANTDYNEEDLIKNNSCLIKDFFKNKCKNNFLYEEDIISFKYNIISSIENGSLAELLTQVVNNGTEFVIKEGNEIYQISTVSNQMNNENNLTNINFTLCEEKLRKELGIEDDELIILKIEHLIEGYNIPVIEYSIFLENGSYLSLDYCDNIYSSYYIPVSINENNLFKHNSSSEYYNDECNKYTTENGTDVTIYDRKNDYNENHLSLCEANCTFQGYNSSNLKAECLCKTKSHLYTVDELLGDDLLNKIENEQKLTNLNLIKCSNLISTEEIKNNTGFIIIAIIIILFIIIMIIFCVKGYNNLEKKIDEVIAIKFKPKKNTKKNKSRSLINQTMLNKNKKQKQQLRRKSKKLNTLFNKNSKNSIIKGTNKIIRVKTKLPTMIVKEDKEEINEDDFMKCTNDYELNNLSYELALKYDKRKFCDYYSSLIRTKQIIFFSFCDFNDYNSGVIKKFIFFLSFALHYTINALFFTDETMHQIYQDGGKYNIIFQFPNITYSAIISTVILRIILVTLVLTDKSIVGVKNQPKKILAEKKKKSVLKCVIIKFSIFSILNLILLVVFWYYLTCFNALYKNTQIDLIINSVISFGLSSLYPFFINIIPTFFRMDSLSSNKVETKKNKNNNNINKEGEYVYKVSNWLQLL